MPFNVQQRPSGGGFSLPEGGEEGQILVMGPDGLAWGDAGEGGGGASILTGSFSGPLSILTGSARWYPTTEVTVTRVWASLGISSLGDTSFDIRRNGVSILSAPLTVDAGLNRSGDVVLDPSVTVAANQYLTMAITSTTGGRDATVFIQYEE